MRRLSLILSDLYLPEDGGARRDSRRPLPNCRTSIGCCDSRMAPQHPLTGVRGCGAELGRRARGSASGARLRARRIAGPATLRRAWLATPVHARSAARSRAARRSRAAASRRRRTRAAWLRGVRARVRPAIRAPRCWRARLLAEWACRRPQSPAADPARLLDADIGPALPAVPRSRRIAAPRDGNRDVAAWRGGQCARANARGSAACRRCGCGAAERRRPRELRRATRERRSRSTAAIL